MSRQGYWLGRGFQRLGNAGSLGQDPAVPPVSCCTLCLPPATRVHCLASCLTSLVSVTLLSWAALSPPSCLAAKLAAERHRAAAEAAQAEAGVLRERCARQQQALAQQEDKENRWKVRDAAMDCGFVWQLSCCNARTGECRGSLTCGDRRGLCWRSKAAPGPPPHATTNNTNSSNMNTTLPKQLQENVLKPVSLGPAHRSARRTCGCLWRSPPSRACPPPAPAGSWPRLGRQRPSCVSRCDFKLSRSLHQQVVCIVLNVDAVWKRSGHQLGEMLLWWFRAFCSTCPSKWVHSCSLTLRLLVAAQHLPSALTLHAASQPEAAASGQRAAANRRGRHQARGGSAAAAG